MAATGSKTRWACAFAASATLASVGCGDEAEDASVARPLSPISVTAAITDDRVAVKPRRFGAGPIVLVVSNRTHAARSFTFETAPTAGRSRGVRQTTSPINPASTARLEMDVREGIYRLSADGGRAGAASIRVGRPRPIGQTRRLVP